MDRRGLGARLRRVEDPGELAELYGRHPEVHPYGLADLEEPYWSRSTWYRDGDTVVGVLDLGSGEPVLYAIAHDAATSAATLDLLERLAPELPDHFVITGPVGLSARVGRRYRADWVIPHTKMHLVDPACLPEPDPAVEVLDRGAEPAVVALRAHSDDSSAFFVPALLETGHYLGLREGDDLTAVAGVHVISVRYGVAAIGNVLTHPARRRRGLARRLVTTLARRLHEAVPTVGLNVGVANRAARALYEDLGFGYSITYEEAELRRN